ncbi:AEL273Cp [Eremothecium gossypii ATCC 10895]|uniref:AEL273Cp n=1 Tax=Eremothecium gossypii (strain ATCC 10895 / CBS 109.51 / FGSC 9923 / NRRL Y-1056) TaxID=284811 RepID=Q758M8_EREGS|nr:AEL273Cp [Eremothecium gossypii ATCC 10895]AAS52411.1 AEL273Cp [Eremothecium gossypii ATCC 10895]AEY96709.1 FAEL273Cp [Eremothecium gossypii FDAG1]
MNRREKQVVIACVGSRLLISLAFPSLQQQLDNAVEFSTPVTSFRSLQEGVFLLQNNLPVYDGGVVHHLPLLVTLMSVVTADVAYSVLYAVMDALVAYQLMAISRQFKQLSTPSWVPGALYVVNPLVLLSCVSRSTVLFSNLALTTALLAALRDEALLAAVAIAAAGYLSFYAGFLVVPLLAVLQRGRLLTAVVAALCLALFQLASYRLSDNSWVYLRSSYGVIITFSKLMPNLGLWWYFFIEMFDFFIPFFKAVFNIFAVAFITPFSIRFWQQPFYAFVLCLGWITLTKSYPTLGEGGFFLSFVPFFQPLFIYLRHSVVSTLLFMHAIILSPTFYHLWVDLGSGNSNFFYAISLLYALALASVIIDLCWSMLRIEYDRGNPVINVKLTQL